MILNSYWHRVEILLPKLMCLKCGSKDLALDKKNSRIVCRNCGEEYPIVEGIPVMLPSEEERKRYNVEVFDKNPERYDGWFEGKKGNMLYRMELDALKMILSNIHFDSGVEIGVGSGRFATSVGVKFGLDPSINLLKMAVNRGVLGVLGVAELTPFRDNSFDLALIMFSICFVKDSKATFREIRRVVRGGGYFAIGFIPKGSTWGDYYIERGKEGGIFYREINLHSEEEIRKLAERNGFEIVSRVGTLTQPPNADLRYEEPRSGGDDFNFVVHLYRKAS